MTADGTEHRILVGNRFLDGSFLEHITSDNGEADMLSGHSSRVAREGRDVVSLVQRLLHQGTVQTQCFCHGKRLRPLDVEDFVGCLRNLECPRDHAAKVTGCHQVQGMRLLPEYYGSLPLQLLG